MEARIVPLPTPTSMPTGRPDAAPAVRVDGARIVVERLALTDPVARRVARRARARRAPGRRRARAQDRPARAPGRVDVRRRGRRAARVREARRPDDGGQRAGGPRRRGRAARQLRRRRRAAAAHAREVPRRPRRAAPVRQRAVRRDAARLRDRAHRRPARPVLRRRPRRRSPSCWTRPGSARRSTSSARRSPTGFAGLHERLAALEASSRARADERSRSAAKGGDFEVLLEGMLGDARPGRRRPARPHRDRDRRHGWAPRRATSS